jgi:hypothetical protein
MATEIENPELEEVVVNTGPPTYRTYDVNRMLNQNFLKSSKFAIRIPILPDVAGGEDIRSEEFTFLCDSIEFPGQTLTTTEHRIPGRQKVKYAYQRDMNEVTMTFYHNTKFPLYQILSNWITNISPTNTNNQFFDDTVCNIELFQFEDTTGARGLFSTFEEFIQFLGNSNSSSKYMTVKLLNAYPLNFASMPSNWADDGFQKMTVTFFYERYTLNMSDTTTKFKDLLRSGNLVDPPGINSPARPPTNLDFFRDPNTGTRNA